MNLKTFNMNAKEFFESQISTDANQSIVDIYASKYSKSDLLKFAEAYHEAGMRNELIKFEEWLIDVGDITILKGVDDYLATRKNK